MADKTDIIRFYTLCSGSSGNCTYVRIGNDEVLIDAGESMKSISSSLAKIGTSIENISAIFITHEHIDHIKGCFMIAKYHKVPIHILKECASFLGETDKNCVFTHETGDTVNIGDLYVESFKTSHDSASSCGYIIGNGKIKIGVATDTGYITSETKSALLGARHILIESNYDLNMLRYGPYPKELKARVASDKGHLSNPDCAEFCGYLAENGTVTFALAHLSKENNTPARALSEVRRSVFKSGFMSDVVVAERSGITKIYDSEVLPII